MSLRRLTSVGLAASCLIVAACSNGSDTVAEPDPSATSAVGPSSTPEAEPEPTATVAVAESPSVDDAKATWLSVWAGAEFVVSDPAAAEAMIKSVATDAVYERLEGTFNPRAIAKS